MASILYIWKSPYPWDVRVEKVCSALNNAGHRVTILSRCAEGLAARDTIDGLSIIRAGCGKPAYLYAPVSGNPYWKKAIAESIEICSPDLIIVREIMLAETAAKLARRKNIPVLMDMAENYPAAMKLWKKYDETLLRRTAVHYLDIPERVEKRAVALMDGIITVCIEQIQRLSDSYAFPSEKIKVVHNTALPEKFANVRKGSSIPPIVFGHHGYLSAEKNIEILIRGFALAARELDDIKLELAGSGECLEELISFSIELGINDRVIFGGSYDNTELSSILGRIDVGIIPYLPNDFNNYTLHNKVFDFLACGKPVILSATIPFSRLNSEINAGITADCTKPENIARAIIEIRHADLQSFSENGLKAAESKYNWKHDASELINFVEKYI